MGSRRSPSFSLRANNLKAWCVVVHERCPSARTLLSLLASLMGPGELGRGKQRGRTGQGGASNASTHAMTGAWAHANAMLQDPMGLHGAVLQLPVEVPNGEWTLWVQYAWSPDSWDPHWKAPLLAMVVILSVLISTSIAVTMVCGVCTSPWVLLQLWMGCGIYGVLLGFRIRRTSSTDITIGRTRGAATHGL